MIMKAMKEGSNFFEWTHNRLNGENFSATVLLSRINLKGKEALQATVRDITKQKEAEEDIRVFQRGFERSPNSMILVDYRNKKPVITKVNRKFSEYYGYSEKEALGRNPKMINSGKQSRGFYQKMWKTLLDPKKGAWDSMVVNKTKKGKLVHVLLSITTLFDKNSKPEKFIANHVMIDKKRLIKKR